MHVTPETEKDGGNRLEVYNESRNCYMVLLACVLAILGQLNDFQKTSWTFYIYITVHFSGLFSSDVKKLKY